MKSYNYKFVDFISGNNTLIIRDEKGFEKFKTLLNKIGMIGILRDDLEFDDWLHLSKINNCYYGYVIFEYNNHKGLTFGYSIQSSKDWYDLEPIEIDLLEV